MAVVGKTKTVLGRLLLALGEAQRVRTLTTCSVVRAGFQGFQGVNMTMEQRQISMERKKKLIRKLENQALEMKPIKDFYIRHSWRLPSRQRHNAPATAVELERRILLQKDWARYVHDCKKQDDEKLLNLQQSQEKALYELRQESEDLYQAAMEVDESLLPFFHKGPSETPPIKDYKAPMGHVNQLEERFD